MSQFTPDTSHKFHTLIKENPANHYNKLDRESFQSTPATIPNHRRLANRI